MMQTVCESFAGLLRCNRSTAAYLSPPSLISVEPDEAIKRFPKFKNGNDDMGSEVKDVSKDPSCLKHREEMPAQHLFEERIIRRPGVRGAGVKDL